MRSWEPLAAHRRPKAERNEEEPMKRAVVLVVFLCLAAAVAAASGTCDPELPRGAVRLGVQEVDFRLDVDTFPVSALRGRFRRLYFHVTGNDLAIARIVVRYSSGADEEVEVLHEFREGSRSRIIDLAGARRSIRWIRIVYGTVGAMREGKASIAIYGIR
jgi:hypothetical protein